MKTIILISGILALAFSFNANADYYYSDNRQIPLFIDSTKVLILFDDDYQFNYDVFFMQYPRIDSLITSFAQDQFRVAEINSGGNLNAFMDSLLQDYRVALVNPYFKNRKDSSLFVGRTICCKFGDNVSYDFIDSLNNEYDVEIVYENEITPKLFLLSVMDDAENSTLEIANIYYELDETDFCHPNFRGGFEWNGYPMYDHFWEEQWGMERIFRAYAGSPDSMNHRVFEITTGDTNITVAIIDQGIGLHHDIFEDQLADGYDFANMDDDPLPCDFPDFFVGWHGQAMAGIVGASHNRDLDSINNPNTGVYGIAPSCKIMPIKMGTGFITDILIDTMQAWINYPNCRGYAFVDNERLSLAVQWAWNNGADIISISWGGPNPSDRLQFEFEQAITYGRDGKGCGIFSAAGNTPSDTTSYPAMYPEVMSVGALHPDDSLWWYSWRGKVDVVAPSGTMNSHSIWTDDLLGDAGFNSTADGPAYDQGCGDPDNDDFNCKFGGTSAAQPVAAGVAALVLAARPDLTREQLYDVIRNSADNKLYDTITSPPDPKYGYGMVHPMRALLAVSRGNPDNNDDINLLDILYIISYKYDNGPEPIPHPLRADANGDGEINLMDILYIMSYLYDTPPGPPPPISFDYGEYEF
jgi:subtilisin family serine protease